MTLQHNDQSASILPRNPNRAMEETIRAIQALQNVYERETEALANLDTHAFLALQDEKLDTARLYQRSINEIVRRKDEMQGANPAIRIKLQEMQKDFSVLAKKNLEAIGRMQRTTERLGNTIRRAAKDAVREKSTYNYSETGEVEDSSKKRVSMGVSETA